MSFITALQFHRMAIELHNENSVAILVFLERAHSESFFISFAYALVVAPWPLFAPFLRAT